MTLVQPVSPSPTTVRASDVQAEVDTLVAQKLESALHLQQTQAGWFLGLWGLGF